MATLPGGLEVTDQLPPLPGSQPQPTPSPLPAFWFDTASVLARVLALVDVDPQLAADVWREYKRLRGL